MSATAVETESPQAKPDPKPTSERKQSSSKTGASKTSASTSAKPKTAAKPKTESAGRGGARPKSALPDETEAKVVEAVTSVVPEGDEWHAAALRYGRKVAKVSQGLRATPPPLAGLSKQRANDVRAAVETALAK
jgi:hypothetical protein